MAQESISSEAEADQQTEAKATKACDPDSTAADLTAEDSPQGWS